MPFSVATAAVPAATPALLFSAHDTVNDAATSPQNATIVEATFRALVPIRWNVVPDGKTMLTLLPAAPDIAPVGDVVNPTTYVVSPVPEVVGVVLFTVTPVTGPAV